MALWQHCRAVCMRWANVILGLLEKLSPSLPTESLATVVRGSAESSSSSSNPSATSGSGGVAAVPLATPAPAPGSIPQPSSSPGRSGPDPAADPDLLEQQLLRATAAGESAAAMLDGRRRCVSKTPRRPGGSVRNHYYVVIRARPGNQFQGCLRNWDECHPYVAASSGLRIAPSAIFHAFPSLPEAQAYWRAALPGSGLLVYAYGR